MSGAGSDGAAGPDAAPARVILAQLCYLMRAKFDGVGGAESPHGDVAADLAACLRLAEGAPGAP